MSNFKRFMPVVAMLALGACTDPAGPTDPVATASAEGVEQQDEAARERARSLGGEGLGY